MRFKFFVASDLWYGGMVDVCIHFEMSLFTFVSLHSRSCRHLLAGLIQAYIYCMVSDIDYVSQN